MQFKVQRNEAGYRFISILSEKYNAKKTLIWINKEIPTKNNLLEFPIKNAMLTKTEKKSLVIRFSKTHTLHCKEIASIYRGDLKVAHEYLDEDERIDIFTQYHSPAGALGQTKLVFASIKVKMGISWNSTANNQTIEGHMKLEVI
jgi:hypothetical protein